MAKLVRSCSYYLLLSCVRVAPLPCAFEVTPLLYPIKGRQVAPPIVWMKLLFEMPWVNLLFPWIKGRVKLTRLSIMRDRNI